MVSNKNTFHIKITALNKIYNFVVLNFTFAVVKILILALLALKK
jgi:hypothetical protein